MAKGTTTNSSGRRKNISYSRYGYFFIFPFFLIYAIFSLVPLLSTFWFSTTNIGSSTSEMFGFSDLEVYYDEYLDINDYIKSEDVLTEAGIDSASYAKMKAYFVLQDFINDYDPLNKDNLTAIAKLSGDDGLSSTTIDSLNSYISSGDLTTLTSDALTEISQYYKDNSASMQDVVIMDGLNTLSSTLDTTIVNPVVEDTADSTTVSDPRANVIAALPAVSEQLDTLKAAQKDSPNAVLQVEYYATKLNGGDALTGDEAFDFLIDYIDGVVDGTNTLVSADFYSVIYGLTTPNGTGLDVNADETPDALTAVIPTTAFSASNLTDFASLMLTEVWQPLVNDGGYVSSFLAYASADKDIKTESLFDDLSALNDAGIVHYDALVLDGDVLVTDSSANSLLNSVRSWIDGDTPATTDIKLNAIAGMRTLANYLDRAEKLDQAADITAAGGISQYMNYAGDRELDIDKYLQFKDVVGLTDVLSMDAYEKLDSDRKDRLTASAQETLDEANAALPEAQSTYDAAVASGDKDEIRKAKESLAKVKSDISTSQAKIDTPSSMLEQVDAKTKYISVGMDNYISVFTSTDRFNRVFGSLVTTLILFGMNFVPQILIALLLAAWMTDNRMKLKGMNLMKALVYLPNVMTAATVAIFFYRAFSFSSGTTSMSLAQRVLHIFGHDPVNFFISPFKSRCLISFINFWMWYGNTMIVFIAGISSISVSLYESAQIDGATGGQLFRKITLPLIRPIMLFSLVNNMIGGLQMFDIPKLLTNTGTPIVKFNGTYINSCETILMYIYRQAFTASNKQIGLAAAVSILLFVVTSLFSSILFYLMRDRDASKAKKLAKKGGVK